MKLDYIFIVNIIASLSIFFVLFLILFKLYYKIRSKFDIVVNCWFCNQNSRVSFNERNSWVCPNSVCQQYNGFKDDGDYNKEIIEQFDSSKNNSGCSRNSNKSEFDILSNDGCSIVQAKNGFCNDCNENQRLKVEKLSQFEPKKESKYEEELKEYRRHLEELYRLCPTCERQLAKTLRDKKKIILGSKFLHLLTKRTTDILKNYPKVVSESKIYHWNSKTLIGFFIFFFSIVHSYFIIQNTIQISKTSFDDVTYDSITHFFLNFYIFVVGIIKVFKTFISEILNIPTLQKIFLFSKSIAILILKYFGLKLPKFYIDNNTLITFGIPLSNIFLTFFLNILDGFQITRYTVLLTIWSMNVGLNNLNKFAYAESFKIITSIAGLIFALPNLKRNDNFNTENSSFHKIHSDEILSDDEDSISLLSSYSNTNLNNSAKSIKTSPSKVLSNINLASSPQFVKVPSAFKFGNNMHASAVNYQNNIGAFSSSNTFTPVSSSIYPSVPIFGNKRIDKFENSRYEMKENPFTNKFCMNLGNRNNHTNFFNQNVCSPLLSPTGFVSTKDNFHDRNSLCSERFTQSPFGFSSINPGSSRSLLSPSRLSMHEKCNYGFNTQSWVSGGFFNTPNTLQKVDPNLILTSNFTLNNMDKTYNAVELSRASSSSSGFESNSSSMHANGFRYGSTNNIDSIRESQKVSNPVINYEEQGAFDYVSPSQSINRFTNDRFSLERTQPQHFEPSVSNLNHSASLQNLNTGLYPTKSNFESTFGTQNDNSDWRPFSRMTNSIQSNANHNINTFNFTRINDELRPIERGSLLRKWKENNCIS